MELKPLKIKVLPQLTNTGFAMQLQGNYQMSTLDVGSRHFELQDGIYYQLDLSNTGEAILLSGSVGACLLSACDRCLENAATQILGQAEGYYLLEESQDESAEDSEAEFELVDQDGVIDLAPALLAAIVIELPTIVLCHPQCRGICAGCGANLNLGDCDCQSDADTVIDQSDVNPNSPFAALKDLL